MSSPNAIGKFFIPFFLKFSSTKFDKSAQSLTRDAFTMAFFKFYSYRYFSYLACFYFSYIYFIFCSWSSSYCFFLSIRSFFQKLHPQFNQIYQQSSNLWSYPTETKSFLSPQIIVYPFNLFKLAKEEFLAPYLIIY